MRDTMRTKHVGLAYCGTLSWRTRISISDSTDLRGAWADCVVVHIDSEDKKKTMFNTVSRDLCHQAAVNGSAEDVSDNRRGLPEVRTGECGLLIVCNSCTRSEVLIVKPRFGQKIAVAERGEKSGRCPIPVRRG